MKKVITAFSLLFVCSVFAQEIFYEGFESNVFPPKGWVQKVPKTGGWKEPSWEWQNWNQKDGKGACLYDGPLSDKVDAWLLTKGVSLKKGKTYEYSFWIKKGSYHSDPVEFTFAMGKKQDENDLDVKLLEEVFDPITQGAFDLGEYELRKGELIVQDDGDYYFGFKVASASDLFIDEIKIQEKIPCLVPNGMKMEVLYTDGVKISWNKNNGSKKYHYKVVAIDDDFNGNAIAEGEVVENEVEIRGLVSNTSYKVYIKSECNGAYGYYSNEYAFETLCEAIDSINEDFDASDLSNTIPDCWSKILDGDDLSKDSDVKGGWLTGQTDLIKEGGTDENVILVTPKLSNINTNNYRVRFRAIKKKSRSANPGILRIGTVSNTFKGSSFLQMGNDIIVESHLQDKEYKIDFIGTSAKNFIAIKNASESGITVSIEEFRWEPIPNEPSCVEVTEPGIRIGENKMVLQSLTPDFAWRKDIDATGYKIRIGSLVKGNDIYEKDLGNTSAYSLPEAILEYDTTYYVSIVPYNEKGDAKNCESLEIKTITNPNFGGGDLNTIYGGYYFANSTEGANESPIQPTYEWVDPIQENHEEVKNWGQIDELYKYRYFKIPSLGFDFPFYNDTYNKSEVFVNSNGSIHFGEGSLVDGDQEIPKVDVHNNFIAACMWQYIFSAETKVYYKSYGNKFVVTWYKMVNRRAQKEQVTFQLILKRNGDAIVQINNEISELHVGEPYGVHQRALIGVENHEGTKGVLYRKMNPYGEINPYGVRNVVGPILEKQPLAVVFSKSNKKQVYLELEPSLHGKVAGIDQLITSGFYNKGSLVRLVPVPDEGYYFVGWKGDASGNDSPLDLEMNEDKVISALFSKKQYVLTMNLVGNGAVTADVAPVNGTYAYGTVVRLTATPDKDWVFDGWNEDSSKLEETIIIMMDEDKTISAKFIAAVAGIEDEILLRKIQVYPNPVEDFVKIQTEESLRDVRIYNVLGKELLRLKAKNVDFSSLPKGIYFLIIRTKDHKKLVKKIIKK
ncbi:T9SS type A sorting domain-containing protein [Tenacibaculum maritimum]|nr:T9SS type A sorting domain-containing protein [Tenacibaculum maritimum]MDB0610589.1 T9SS type A sorting domain-containing protein [Tenacibaculum maritimum]